MAGAIARGLFPLPPPWRAVFGRSPAVSSAHPVGCPPFRAPQLIKENLDKRFGSPWHVVVGKHFSYDVTCEARHLVLVFTAGQMSCLAWKH